MRKIQMSDYRYSVGQGPQQSGRSQDVLIQIQFQNGGCCNGSVGILVLSLLDRIYDRDLVGNYRRIDNCTIVQYSVTFMDLVL
jgi:hypothetical protein